MNIPIDIETIPDQREGARERFIEESIDNFKAPSDLTKARAAFDLCIKDPKEMKFTSKDEMIAKWVEEFKGVKAEQVGIENWRKTALNGSQGQIFSIAWKDDIINCAFSMDEKEVLNSFNDQLMDSCIIPYFIGHNISGFDLKFIWQRFVINGIEPKFKLPHNGRHGKDYFDNMIEWVGYKNRISQDNLCKALGVEGKSGDIDGSKVWDFVEAGEYGKVAEYNKDDTLKASLIYSKLTFKKG